MDRFDGLGYDVGLNDIVVPFPTERGVSAQTDVVRRQMLDPFSDDMGLVERQEPAWSDQFAPGGGGLLGADPVTPQAPLESLGSPAPRSDDPVGPTDPPPWTDSFAPAPSYPPRTASRERFENTFARSALRPDERALLPGTSDRANAVAYRGLGDSLAQAGVRGLDGRLSTSSSDEGEELGSNAAEEGAVPAPQAFDLDTYDRIPTPKVRPTERPAISPLLPGERPSGLTRPTIPVPTTVPRRGTGLVPQHHRLPTQAGRSDEAGAIGQFGPSCSGPERQIFDFVLRQLLRPART